MSASSDFDPHPGRPQGKRRRFTVEPLLSAADPNSLVVGAFTAG